MANIECNEINQTVNELLIAFADCNKIKNEDDRWHIVKVVPDGWCSPMLMRERKGILYMQGERLPSKRSIKVLHKMLARFHSSTQVTANYGCNW